MTEHSDETAHGSLVIVEAGATVPAGIFSTRDCSDHAVVRQSEQESLTSLLSRVRRRICDFIASSVRPTNILVVLRDAWTHADMLERELLGRSLLELNGVNGAELTFRARSDDEHLAERLLSLVAVLIEGTRDCSVSLAMGPGPKAAHALAPLAANAA